MTNPPDATDETLVRRFQSDPHGKAGRAAVESLLERYAERIYLWCFRVTREHDAALDMAQEVALEVLESLHQFRGESRFSTWAYTVTRHRCLRARRRPRLFADEPPDFDTLPASGPGPETEAGRRMDEEALRKLMRETLTPEESAALWMRCVEGVAIEDITRMLGLTNASGARALLQTARRKLRAAPGAAAFEGEA